MPLTPWGDPSLWEGIFMVPLAYITRKYNLYQKFKDNKWFFETVANFTFYQWISIATLTAGGLIMITFTNFGMSNLVALRVATGPVANATLNYAGAGHWLTWLGLFIVYVRYGATDVLKGVSTMLFYGSLHESLWYFAYLYVKPENVSDIFYYYLPFTAFTYGALFTYLILFRNVVPKRKVFVAVSFMITFYALWVGIGFPITIDNVTGNTPFYNNLDVNFIESYSWLGLAFLVI
jgi:hypothetical protein